MKTLFSIIIFIFIATMVSAAPYLVCDPQAGVTSYAVNGQTFAPVEQPAQPDGSIKMDVGGAPPGDTALAVSACYNDPIWGRYCSASTPFTLTRPAPLLAPKQLKLAP